MMPDRLCATCQQPIRGGKPSALAKRRYCGVACAHAAQQKPAPQESLLVVVRAFLAEGLPMTHSGYGVACAFCGASLEALLTAPTAGHADGCRWVRLRQRVAGES